VTFGAAISETLMKAPRRDRLAGRDHSEGGHMEHLSRWKEPRSSMPSFTKLQEFIKGINQETFEEEPPDYFAIARKIEACLQDPTFH